MTNLLKEQQAPFQSRSRFINTQRLLASHSSQLHERSLLPGHITASLLILSHDSKQVLTIVHGQTQRRLCPGGHLDRDEDPYLSALREAQEETGIDPSQLQPLPTWSPSSSAIDLDVHTIPANPKKQEAEHEHHDVMYAVRAPKDVILQTVHDEGASQLEWSPIEQWATWSPRNQRAFDVLEKYGILRVVLPQNAAYFMQDTFHEDRWQRYVDLFRERKWSESNSLVFDPSRIRAFKEYVELTALASEHTNVRPSILTIYNNHLRVCSEPFNSRLFEIFVQELRASPSLLEQLKALYSNGERDIHQLHIGATLQHLGIEVLPIFRDILVNEHPNYLKSAFFIWGQQNTYSDSRWMSAWLRDKVKPIQYEDTSYAATQEHYDIHALLSQPYGDDVIHEFLEDRYSEEFPGKPNVKDVEIIQAATRYIHWDGYHPSMDVLIEFIMNKATTAKHSTWKEVKPFAEMLTSLALSVGPEWQQTAWAGTLKDYWLQFPEARNRHLFKLLHTDEMEDMLGMTKQNRCDLLWSIPQHWKSSSLPYQLSASQLVEMLSMGLQDEKSPAVLWGTLHEMFLPPEEHQALTKMPEFLRLMQELMLRTILISRDSTNFKSRAVSSRLTIGLFYEDPLLSSFKKLFPQYAPQWEQLKHRLMDIRFNESNIKDDALLQEYFSNHMDTFHELLQQPLTCKELLRMSDLLDVHPSIYLASIAEQMVTTDTPEELFNQQDLMP